MNEGWVKLYRQSLDSRVFQSANLWKVWSWCLLKAGFREHALPVVTGRGVSDVSIGPGQFLFGRNAAAKDLRLPASTVNDLMRRLQTLGNIDIQPNTHFSIVTVCNWETYQESFCGKQQATQQATDTQPAGNQQATDTNKNVKNAQNGEKGPIDHISKGGCRGENGEWPEDLLCKVPAFCRRKFSPEREAVFPGPIVEQDKRLLLQLGFLHLTGKVLERWIDDGLEAIRRHDGPIQNRAGYLRQVIRGNATKAGEDLDAMLARVVVPEHLLQKRPLAVPSTPPGP